MQTVKSWLGTAVLLLATLQVLTAFARSGWRPRAPGRPWLTPVHRWSGRLALLLSLPHHWRATGAPVE